MSLMFYCTILFEKMIEQLKTDARQPVFVRDNNALNLAG